MRTCTHPCIFLLHIGSFDLFDTFDIFDASNPFHALQEGWANIRGGEWTDTVRQKSALVVAG